MVSRRNLFALAFHNSVSTAIFVLLGIAGFVPCSLSAQDQNNDHDWSVQKVIPVGDSPERAVLTPDGRELYVANHGSDGTVSVIDTRTGVVKATVRVGAAPGTMAMSHNGQHVYVLIENGLSIIDTGSKTVKTLPLEGRTDEMAITGDDARVYLTRVYTGLQYLDTKTDKIVPAIDTTCPIGVAVSKDDRLLYVNYQCFGPGGSMAHDAFGVYKLPSHELIATVRGFPNVGGQVVLSADGSQVWLQGFDACSRFDYPHEGCPGVPTDVVNVLRTADFQGLTHRQDFDCSDPTGPCPLVRTFGFSLEDINGRISMSPDGVAFVGGGIKIKEIDTRQAGTIAMEHIVRLPIACAGDVAFAPDGQTAWLPLSATNACTGETNMQPSDPGEHSDRNIVVMIARGKPAAEAANSVAALTLATVRKTMLTVSCNPPDNLSDPDLREAADKLHVANAASLQRPELIEAVTKAQMGKPGCVTGAVTIPRHELVATYSERGVASDTPGQPITITTMAPDGDPYCFIAERLAAGFPNDVLQQIMMKKDHGYAQFIGLSDATGDILPQEISGGLVGAPVTAMGMELGPKVVYLNSFVCADRVMTILIREGQETLVREGIENGKPVTQTILQGKVDTLRIELRDPCSNPLQDAEDLYHILIPPDIEKALDDARQHAPGQKLTLLWELDDQLRYIPPAALSYDGQHYLVERDATVMLGQSNPLLSAQPEGKLRAVAAADANLDGMDHLETLPRTTDEVNSVFYPETGSRVSGKIPAIMLVNDGQAPDFARFTASDLQSSLNHLVQTGGDDKLIVHIASHFELTNKAETSFLLTRSGELTLTDLSKNFKFTGVWLVTLSACNTANPQTTTTGGVGNSGVSDGRETEALAYLVGGNGAHSVLASLWAVRDESTALLMQSFYTAIQQGATKSAALQKAELFVMHAAPPLPILEPQNGPTKCMSETYAHPKFWAPFILIGDRQ